MGAGWWLEVAWMIVGECLEVFGVGWKVVAAWLGLTGWCLRVD